MGKKVKEYKSGDFIFAKVKGYPAWPARVQRLNGKKYFVYFYGTGEIANLPPTQIFDYAENKDKFLTKTVKRRDFNDGVKQIEHDFANNVPLEEVVGLSLATSEDVPANDAMNDTAEDTMIEDTTLEESVTEENTKQKDTIVEDSDDTGSLVIDEAKQKGRKSTVKTPAKETPKPKEMKTPRAKARKDDTDESKEEKDEEIVSRSGRKIRPKRYLDEHTAENSTLPTPVPKKRRALSPALEKEKMEVPKDTREKNIRHYNTIAQSELEDLKEPFTKDTERDNILIAYLPSGEYVGIKLFQSRPVSFKNEAAKLQWDKQSATNSITLKTQLERGHISSHSIMAQLVLDLNLTEEEKATLDKERQTEKKSRVQFLKTEMKLIELDAKIKTCLCLEKADTELCLKLLDELMDLEVKPLMLLKHPSCLETIKRMRAYVGNTPSWDLSERDVLLFSQHAHRIRRQADALYTKTKGLFTVPDGLSFWEYFQGRVAHFKQVVSKLSSDELLEMVHEPIEMFTPAAYNMRSAINAVNEPVPLEDDKKKPQDTAKKSINTLTKPQQKRQAPKKKEEKETADINDKPEEIEESIEKENELSKDILTDKQTEKEKEEINDVKEKKSQNDKKEEKENETKKDSGKDKKSQNEIKKISDKKRPSTEENQLNSDGPEETSNSIEENLDLLEHSNESDTKVDEKSSNEETTLENKVSKESTEKKENDSEEKNDKDKNDEPKTKRLRESKKTDTPSRSPMKRKSKF